MSSHLPLNGLPERRPPLGTVPTILDHFMHIGVIYALLAAVLFGASTPFAKTLVGQMPPVALAASTGSTGAIFSRLATI